MNNKSLAGLIYFQDGMGDFPIVSTCPTWFWLLLLRIVVLDFVTLLSQNIYRPSPLVRKKRAIGIPLQVKMQCVGRKATGS